MGCSCSSKAAKIYGTSLKDAKHKQEVEELAELPVRAKDEELDLVTMVEISIKCSGLHVIDRFSSIDPVAYFLVEEEGTFEFKDRTEVQYKTTDPAFISTFKIAYSFEKQLRFKLDVYDNKNITGGEPNRNALIGTNVFTIHEIVCANQRSVAKPLLNPVIKKKDLGVIYVHSDEMSKCNEEVTMLWRLVEDKHKKAYVLKLSRSSDEEFIPVFQSETSVNGGNFYIAWKPFSLSLSHLCKEDNDRPILAEVFEARKVLKFSGKCLFSLSDIKNKRFEKNLENAQGNTNLRLSLENFDIVEKHTFLEYVHGGCAISMIIGIDFTKSNGEASHETSLHHINPEKPNEYIQAIKAVGETLQYYDSDKKIPVFGFGAKLPPKFDVVSHCFAINENIFDPEIEGIDEVLSKYTEVLGKIHLHGPTHFSEIIQKSAKFAESANVSQDRQQYFILLILTDGIINDLEETIDELVIGCNLPLSIIIVGVGNEDFSTMKLLDADVNPLFSKKYNKNVERDIVQFVPYKQFKGTPYALAREVLYEIPEQVLEFMRLNNIRPGIAKHTILRNGSKTFSPSATNSINANDYLIKEKSEFIEEAIKLGLSRPSVENIVNKGIFCKSFDLLTEMVENKNKPKPKSILKSSSGGERRKSVQVHLVGKNKNYCFMCQANLIDVILQDCGCEIVCSKCVQVIGKDCPSCSTPIVKWIKKIPPSRAFDKHRASVS